MAKLIAIFPHTGDDGIQYEPGMHRDVEDHLVESFLRPQGTLTLYVLFEAPQAVKAAPVFKSELELIKEEAKPVLEEPETEASPEKEEEPVIVEDKPKKKK